MRAFHFLVAVASLAVAGCGSSSSSNTAIDASGGDDASVDGSTTTPGMLTLSGIAREISAGGQTPIAGVMLTAYNAADDSVLGMAASAADGTFSITAKAPAGTDGYLKATTPGTGQNAYKDTYLYPPATLTANLSNVPVFVLKVSTYDLANRLLGNGQTAQNGWIALIVQDAAMMPVAGAKVTSTPMGQVNYNANNLPSPGAMSTAADGIAYDTNIAVGTVSVKATKPGSTFAMHSIKVRPDVVTLTLITP